MKPHKALLAIGALFAGCTTVPKESSHDLMSELTEVRVNLNVGRYSTVDAIFESIEEQTLTA